ncbi:MAG: hypothetical protein RMM58_03150 [Chloroflexota bacterium]|nr:hypothetical protein [Dehalococcoidia bacterium]MDW8252855.1 hypothetical protein [Chloroflexota bacterium]
MALSGDGLRALLRLQRLFQETREALRQYLTGDVDAETADFLASETLTHVEWVQQGVRQTARASEASVAEWRAVLRPADLIDCTDSPDGRGSELRRPDLTEIEAANHAKVVLSLVPRVPPRAVSFPGPGLPSYRDIPVPTSPFVLSQRLEEIECAVWHVAARRDPPDFAAFRRVYAFFEAGAVFGGLPLRRGLF